MPRKRATPSREQLVLARLDRKTAWVTVASPPLRVELEQVSCGTIYSITSASHLTLFVKLAPDRWVAARSESLGGAVRAWLAHGEPPARALRDDAKVHKQLSGRVWLRISVVRADEL